MEPWGTPAKISFQLQVLPLSTTLKSIRQKTFY